MPSNIAMITLPGCTCTTPRNTGRCLTAMSVPDLDSGACMKLLYLKLSTRGCAVREAHRQKDIGATDERVPNNADGVHRLQLEGDWPEGDAKGYDIDGGCAWRLQSRLSIRLLHLWLQDSCEMRNTCYRFAQTLKGAALPNQAKSAPPPVCNIG